MYEQWKEKFRLIALENAGKVPDEDITEEEDEGVEVVCATEEFFVSEDGLIVPNEISIVLDNPNVIPGSICVTVESMGVQSTLVDSGAGAFLPDAFGNVTFSYIDYQEAHIEFNAFNLMTDRVVVQYDYLRRVNVPEPDV